jgi:Zn-dependent protease
LAVLNLIPIPPLDGSEILLNILRNFWIVTYIKTVVFFEENKILLSVGLLILIINFNFLSVITFWIYELYHSLVFWI